MSRRQISRSRRRKRLRATAEDWNLGTISPIPRMARRVVGPDHIQVLEAATPAVVRQRRISDARASRRARGRRADGRQEPPCFDGSETVSRLRPFLRRRESTARPQRVAMRARNPCLLMRRLLRGRYDGFIRVPSKMSRGT